MEIVPQKQKLSEEIKRLLLGRIESDEWSKFIPGERELARQMQVSRGSVRLALEALEEDGVISSGGRGKRREVSRRTGHKTDKKSAGVVAYALPDRLSEVPPIILRRVDALREHLAGAGIRLDIVVAKEFARIGPQRALVRLLESHQADLWILFHAPEVAQEWFHKKGIPCIVDGQRSPNVDFPSIDADVHATAFHAGGVLRRNGHERIALLVTDDHLVSYDTIVQGLEEGLRLGRGGLVVVTHQASPDAVCTCLERLMSRSNPPSVVVTARIATTATAYTFLLSKGNGGKPALSLLSLVSDRSIEVLMPPISAYELSASTYTRRLIRMILNELREQRRPGEEVR
ncbi:MAG: GntR family transcriptional regulator, partial [Verrucomicrobiales bacterium]